MRSWNVHCNSYPRASLAARTATIAFNGAAPVPITAQGGAALQGNELTAGGEVVLLITGSGATLIGTTDGNLPVAPGTASRHAAALGQLNTASGLALKTANHLNEIATAGPVAQEDARTNIGAPAATDVLMSGNHLSEIEAAGPAAQASARTNIGAQQAGISLLTVNSLEEITAAGPAAQAAARTNIGAQQAGTSLQTENNLSEIAAAGTDAQASARDNLGITPAEGALLITNNLSEIAAAGPLAQAAAQSNLGLSGSGSNGRLLGYPMVIISSGTYDLLPGTNMMIAEIVGGGGGSGFVSAATSTSYQITQPGYPGSWAIIGLLKSQLSTAASNTIVITIGAGGSGGTSGSGSSGGKTIIDSSLAVAAGGQGSEISVSVASPFTHILRRTGFSPSVTVTSPAVIIENETLYNRYHDIF
ncbi:hypothetical protein EZJ58_1832 [Sodalis ligni]|uniref:Glycine-rich domain-containing protein n=1 Tax=Sodalis ligni TaxID=2697027 RepID=A0A4R1NAQ1_9GAMM|nr:hypothetical protein EZJ58_1832 [Sodalis ligni]